MKKEIKATLLASILAVGIISGTAIAQTGNNPTMMPQQSMRGNMMGGNMMGMRGQGMHGQGMMTQGYAGCTNMMGQGMGMTMMGGGMMYNIAPENQQKFMDDTRDTRKKMHDMRFEYMEAMRNSKTSLGDIADMEQKMLDIRKDMLKKAEKYQSK